MLTYAEMERIGEMVPIPYGIIKVVPDETEMDMTYEYVYVNSQFEKLAGSKASDLLGKSLFEIYPNAPKELAELNYRAACIGEEVKQLHCFAPTNRWVIYAARPCGEEGYCSFTLSNVTELVDFEQSRSHQDHDLLATAINTVYPLCFFANLTKNEFHMVDYGDVDVAQAKNEGVFDDLIEYTITSIPDEEGKLLFGDTFSRSALIEAFERGETQVKLQHRQADDLGRIHWVETMVVFISNAAGDDILEMTLIKTIDKEKEGELLLRDALNDAEMASKAKSQFLSNMSHDIRTPMNAIIGFTSIASKNMDNPIRLKDCLDKISKSSNTLLSIINDVLDMNRIENNKMQMEEVSCNILEMLEEVITVIAPDADAKNLDFTVERLNITEPAIIGDSLKLKRILMNLLSNSVKFTPSGGKITLTCAQHRGAIDGYVATEFKVEDNGIGMSEEFKEHIFETFTRERNTTMSGIAGTGLGLAITKSMVEIMGGVIGVNSKKGEGSEFIVSIPMKVDTTEAEIKRGESAEDEPVASYFPRVLLVEDNEFNREIAVDILVDEGFKVETAVDGIEAVDKVRNSKSGYYNLIFMDVQMPEMNGYEATRAIRNLKDKHLARIPIIAMTANVFEEDRRKAMAAGMDDHIAKPIDMVMVKKSLRRLHRKIDKEEFFKKRMFGRLK